MSNLLTALGVLIFLMFLALLAGWRWSGLVLGLVVTAAGYAAHRSEGADGS